MRIIRTLAAVVVVSLFICNSLLAQEVDKEQLEKRVLKRVEELLKLEEKRILEEVSNLIDKELAKSEHPKGDKKADSKPGYLGVVPGELDDDKKKELKFDGEGVLIAQTHEGTPAEKAGIQEDEIITNICDA